MFLVFDKGSELRIQGFINSDFMFDIDDRESTSGCIFLYNRGSINWKNFKQPIIADSTMKAEYIVTFEVAKEAFWFKKFIIKLDVILSDAMILYYDNNGTISVAKKSKSH